MDQKFTIQKGTVQETLLLPLWGRAYETQKKHPRLVDEKAVEIVEKFDYDFSEIEKTQKLSRHGWVARALHIDKLVRQFIAEHPRATIVNLGCGMDTTFSRIDNGKILFYELDLPDVIALRKNFFHDSDRHKSIASSFLETDYFDQIEVRDGLLFLSGGVFMYFSEEQIKKFFIRLANYFEECEVYFDTLTPRGMKMAEKYVLKKGGMSIPLEGGWALQSAKDLEKWDRRITVLKSPPIYKGTKQNIPLLHKIMLTISDSLNMGMMVHVRIGK